MPRTRGGIAQLQRNRCGGGELAFRIRVGGSTYANDQGHQDLVEDFLEGSGLEIENGRMRMPAGPGSGVALDEQQMRKLTKMDVTIGRSARAMTVSRRGASGNSKPLGARTEIRDLLSYRIHTVANLLSRGAAMRYRRQFGVTLWEWRIIALLGAYAPLSLSEIAASAAIDKGQASRVVAGLIDRSLIERQVNDFDGRSSKLSLTRAGLKTYDGLIAAANERERALRSALSAEELALLGRALELVASQARRLVADEEVREALAASTEQGGKVDLRIPISTHRRASKAR